MAGVDWGAGVDRDAGADGGAGVDGLATSLKAWIRPVVASVSPRIQSIRICRDLRVFSKKAPATP